jgi:hypothetical protein
MLLGLFKFTTDTGLWLMNEPNDLSFTLGMAINVLAVLGILYFLHRLFSPNFNTIKDLFNNK